MAGDPARPEATALPGLAEVDEDPPDVGGEGWQRRWVGQPPGRLDVILPGQAFKMDPQGLAVVLANPQFELFSSEGDQASDEARIKFARLFDAVVTCSAISLLRLIRRKAFSGDHSCLMPRQPTRRTAVKR